MEIVTQLLSTLTERTQAYFATVKELQNVLGQVSCLPLGRLADDGLTALLAFRRAVGLRDFSCPTLHEHAAARIPACASAVKHLLDGIELCLAAAAKKGRAELLADPGISEVAVLTPAHEKYALVHPLFPPARPHFAALVPLALVAESSPWRTTFDVPSDSTLVVKINTVTAKMDDENYSIGGAPRSLPTWFSRRYILVAGGSGIAFTAGDLARMLRESAFRKAQQEEAKALAELNSPEKVAARLRELRENETRSREAMEELMVTGGRRRYY
jgi:hypothetical protein